MLAIEAAAEETGRSSDEAQLARVQPPDPIFTVKALQDLSERIQRADSLKSLVDSILAGFEESFGFKYSMILVPSEEEGVLVTLATRGYADSGAGAEVRIGEGICGMVAEARKPIRISGLMRGMLYALALFGRKPSGRTADRRHADSAAGPGQSGESARRAAARTRRARRRPVPRERDALPLSRRGQTSIELLGSYVAVAIQNMQMHERASDAVADAAPALTAPAAVPAPARRGQRIADATSSTTPPTSASCSMVSI